MRATKVRLYIRIRRADDCDRGVAAFKEMAATGEIPSVKGQSHGEHGLSGGIKEWMYGESNPTPPGSSEA